MYRTAHPSPVLPVWAIDNSFRFERREGIRDGQIILGALRHRLLMAATQIQLVLGWNF
jgi:hypothetical protein